MKYLQWIGGVNFLRLLPKWLKQPCSFWQPPVLRFQDSIVIASLPLLAYNNLETLTDEFQPVLSSDIRHLISLETGPWFVCSMLIKNTSFWFVMWGSTDCLSAIYCHWSVSQLAPWLASRHQVSINFATPAPQDFAGIHHYPLPCQRQLSNKSIDNLSYLWVNEG
jgi:hypothetical protein